VGLSATPFTKGIGKVYENVVSAVTTDKLVNEKVLVPLRVFIAKEINMEGAKKVAGEWSQAEASTRGMHITGDIVTEWIKKTHEIFKGPRKTIVFCAGVAHGADLQKKFAEQGYNFISISYRDDDQYKKDVIADFSKPDTEIHGLIATDILTKGFDVPDVMIGVSARPFSKSLSSHIQQMGRVMRGHPDKKYAVWLCLAKGSKVLTNEGLVPIEKVTLGHKIWDGTNFVTHKGAVCNGNQDVITYQGLTATAGHLVHTAEGWRTFGDCASQQIRITQTGLGGQAIRLGDDLRPASFLAGCAAKKIYSCFVRVHDLWVQKFNLPFKSSKRKDEGLQFMQQTSCRIPSVVIQPSSRNEGSMLLTNKRSVSGLWGARNRIQVFWGKARYVVDYGKSWTSKLFIGGRSITHTARQDKSKWPLRSGKFTMVVCGVESAKQTRQPIGGTNSQVQTKLSRNSLFGQHLEAFLLGWHDGGSNHRAISQALHKTQREVWDILDAGPHNRFTCEGLLVHNCHSGNFLRFREDWDAIYHEGVTQLDDGKEKAKKEPSEKEKKEAKCPKCEALWPARSDVCLHCGHVRERKNVVSSIPGELQELGGGVTTLSKQQWWSMLQYKVQNNGWSPGRAAHTYREKFGVWPRGLSDKPAPPNEELERFIAKRLRAYIRNMKRS